MHVTVKSVLKKFKDIRGRKREIKSNESFCDEQQIDQERSSRELSAAKFNKFSTERSSTSEDFEPFVDVVESKFPCPNIATFLIIILLVIVFVALPIVYLLHCFDLLNTQWPNDEFKRVMTDHSHSNPRQEFHDGSSPVSQPYPNRNDVKHQYFKKNMNHQKDVIYKTKGHKTLQFPPPARYSHCAKIADELKFDCYPEDGANELSCKSRGCCWTPKQGRKIRTSKSEQAPLNVPYCFYPQEFGGYEFVNISKTAFGMTAFLRRTFKSPYPNDILVIRMDVKYENEQRVHVKLYDPTTTRFEPPYPEVPVVERRVPHPDYQVVLDKSKVGFRIIRKKNNVTIFNAQDVGALVFADQFLQLSAILPSSNLYGLGEHRSPLRLSTQWQRFVMFNHDQEPNVNTNLYGSHPFYLVMEENGSSHGVFLLNSNAMEVIVQPAPAVTFRTIGGVLDFFVFLGPSPADVVRQYTDVIGRPYLPPYWGLGFHLCRYGYKNLNDTKEVWSRTRKAGIPLDVQWNDLDYMDFNNDFTYDKEKFEGLPQFVAELHKLGMHYIPLVDAAVSAGEKPGTYPPYDDGISMGIFVKNSTGQPFVGKVWNRVSSVWPDFTYPLTVDYWMKQLQDMHDMFAFDGAWIDMNEPSNFYDGTINGCPNSSLEHPPYLPAVAGGFLSWKTLCMTSQQHAGLHYDTHNLFGFTEAIVTSFAMAEIRGRRPFVISRSTFAGHGHFSGHWSGDIASDWYSMKMSIPQLLSFSLFGIPLMGADICGFNGNTTVALCQRWMQLGAFYPFSRNHNTDDGIPQDPVALGPQVVESSRKALLMRYSLLPYLYTLFWRAHTDGDTVARPIFVEFPQDKQTYGMDEQFLWGPALMIVPVLEEGKTEVSLYLPQCLWYDLHTLALVQGSGQVTLVAPLDTIPLLVRGGHILPTQSPNTTTTESRKNNIELVVAADENGHAMGSLYWDDGDSLNSYEDRQYNLINFLLNSSSLTGSPVWWGYDTPLALGQVVVLGVPVPVKSVFVNQAAHPFAYHTIYKFLQVKNIGLSLDQTFTLHWN